MLFYSVSLQFIHKHSNNNGTFAKQLGHITMFSVVCFFAVNIPVSKHMLQSGYISAYGLTLAESLLRLLHSGQHPFYFER